MMPCQDPEAGPRMAVQSEHPESPEPNDHEIIDLVRGLDNLCWNFQVQAEILGLGARAVPALAAYLLGAPSHFASGRVLAAEALGHIGGEISFQSLLAALDPHRLLGMDPVFRLSEEEVQNAAARELGRLGDRRAIPALLEALCHHRLLGAAAVLVQFHVPSALPWLVEGLEDAFKRARLAEAILTMGTAAIPYLMATLDRRRMYGEYELLPSLERRAEALRLLGLLGAKEAGSAIHNALTDGSDIVRVEAALALTVLEQGDGVLDAVPALLAGLTHSDFLQRDRCVEALIRIGPRVLPFIARTLADGTVVVQGDVVPLTINARMAALAVMHHDLSQHTV
jgi:HEAT repeat protein